MNFDEKLVAKKKELVDMQIDINNIKDEAAKLKPVVVDYNKKMKAASKLKQQRDELQSDFDTVTRWVGESDDTYLTKLLPLFTHEQLAPEHEEQSEAAAQ